MGLSDILNKRKNKNSNEVIEEAYEKYSKMNEQDLMSEMFKTADASRQNGTLTDESLDSFYNNAKGMLTPEQAERMRELIIELKK